MTDRELLELNHDEIIRMAREAGSIDSEEVIETVYAAFAAAEREACAKVAEKMLRFYTQAVTGVPEAIREAIRARGGFHGGRR